jgi:hypothetical protein
MIPVPRFNESCQKVGGVAMRRAVRVAVRHRFRRDKMSMAKASLERFPITWNQVMIKNLLKIHEAGAYS